MSVNGQKGETRCQRVGRWRIRNVAKTGKGRRAQPAAYGNARAKGVRVVQRAAAVCACGAVVERVRIEPCCRCVRVVPRPRSVFVVILATQRE